MSDTQTCEQSDDQSSSTEVEVQRRPRRGGKGGHHKREEPTSLTDLQAYPMAISCFQYSWSRHKNEKEDQPAPYLGRGFSHSS